MECYKKLTLIDSNNKYNKVQTNEASETHRLSSKQSELFEGKCYFIVFLLISAPGAYLNLNLLGAAFIRRQRLFHGKGN